MADPRVWLAFFKGRPKNNPSAIKSGCGFETVGCGNCEREREIYIYIFIYIYRECVFFVAFQTRRRLFQCFFFFFNNGS